MGDLWIALLVLGGARLLTTIVTEALFPYSGPHSILGGAVLRLASLRASELRGMGKRDRRFYQETLSLHTGIRRFLEVFARAAPT